MDDRAGGALTAILLEGAAYGSNILFFYAGNQCSSPGPDCQPGYPLKLR